MEPALSVFAVMVTATAGLLGWIPKRLGECRWAYAGPRGDRKIYQRHVEDRHLDQFAQPVMLRTTT